MALDSGTRDHRSPLPFIFAIEAGEGCEVDVWQIIPDSFNGRIRDELLNETLFFTIGHARSILARWVDDYDNERPHSSPGYATSAAFAAGLEQQRARLTPTVASPALLCDNTGRALAAAG